MGALKDGLSPEYRSDITFIEDSKLQFRDATNYIQSEESGKIKIVGGGTTSDTITLLAKTTISGASVLIGDSSLTGNSIISGSVTLNLPIKDTTAGLTIKDSETFPVVTIDGKGNIKAKGGVLKQ